MKTLLYRKITSADLMKRRIACCELSDAQGIHSAIRRHFVYMVKEVAEAPAENQLPRVTILRQRDTRMHRERFLCRVKGVVYVSGNEKKLKVSFIHSLAIDLSLSEKKVLDVA